MIFTDLRFVVLFVVFGILFSLVARKRRMAVLSVWGILFYALYAGWALVIVLVLVALTYACARRPAFGWLAGIVIVTVLIYFKAVQILPAVPVVSIQPATLIVPLGLSYLAFELLHIIIERRRGRLAVLNFADVLAFAFFAPARIAGPIKRLPDFVRSVEDAEGSASSIYSGLLRVLTGLVKKYVFADVLALRVAEAAASYSLRHAWSVVLAYSLQIYFDFSAYSDIAIGLARMIGIRLPENFEWPYLARNIREFWDRWHITLSHWVRDYVFTPLGRRLFKTKLRPWPAAIAAISYLVTFLVVGAWHGLTAGFLIWGAYHGILLAAYHVVKLKMPVRISDSTWYRSRFARVAATATTFLFVTIGWVPFMLPAAQARKILALMFGVGQ